MEASPRKRDRAPGTMILQEELQQNRGVQLGVRDLITMMQLVEEEHGEDIFLEYIWGIGPMNEGEQWCVLTKDNYQDNKDLALIQQETK